MYHGISAYNKCDKIYELIDRVRTISSKVICFADIPIGPIGIYTAIENVESIDYIATEDIYSERYNNNREFSFFANADIYTDIKKENYREIYELAKTQTKKYVEVGAKASADCLWFNTKYDKKWEKRAKVLSKYFGLYLLYI